MSSCNDNVLRDDTPSTLVLVFTIFIISNRHCPGGRVGSSTSRQGKLVLSEGIPTALERIVNFSLTCLWSSFADWTTNFSGLFVANEGSMNYIGFERKYLIAKHTWDVEEFHSLLLFSGQLWYSVSAVDNTGNLHLENMQMMLHMVGPDYHQSMMLHITVKLQKSLKFATF